MAYIPDELRGVICKGCGQNPIFHVNGLCSGPFTTQNEESVNHPKHYNTGKFEVIDVIEDWKLGFNLGNAVKYIARAGKKNPEKELEDLEKAAWYLNREIAGLKK